VEVFVEDKSSKSQDKVLGRSLQEKKVVFEGSKYLIGTLQSVTLIDIKNETFLARLS
jgi:tRNA A37 methylthiotransferase MiaB